MKFRLESNELKKFVAGHMYNMSTQYRNGEWPTISIVIPSLNQGRFLERTILSVLNQNYPKCELVIIDGGSTDCTLEIITQYGKEIAYWISGKDAGQSDAINKGMRIATGDFIGWQNADDIYLPGAFREFGEVYREYPDYDIYYGNRYYIGEEDQIIGAKYLSKPSLYYYKYRGMILTNQTAFFSKNLVRKYGEVDLSLNYAMDNEFFLRAFLLGAKAKYVPRFWGAMRHHKWSKTGGDHAGQWEEERRYIREKHNVPKGLRYVVHNKAAILVRLIGLIQEPGALRFHLSSRFQDATSRARK